MRPPEAERPHPRPAPWQEHEKNVKAAEREAKEAAHDAKAAAREAKNRGEAQPTGAPQRYARQPQEVSALWWLNMGI